VLRISFLRFSWAYSFSFIVLSAPSLDVLTVNSPLCKSVSLRVILETSSGLNPCLLIWKVVVYFSEHRLMILSILSSVGTIIGTD
jgi:hypothetical protein